MDLYKEFQDIMSPKMLSLDHRREKREECRMATGSSFPLKSGKLIGWRIWKGKVDRNLGELGVSWREAVYLVNLRPHEDAHWRWVRGLAGA